jgi:NADP-dependent 3-hydroxy acid dehydrogenase YdfG
MTSTALLSRTQSDAGLLTGRTAVVTGASSGVGRAIAVALAQRGMRLCITGRNPTALAQSADAVREFSQVANFHFDLKAEEKFQPLIEYIGEAGGKVDVLIHSAGVIHQSRLEQASIAELDEQYATNVRAPYLLTQRLLPALAAAQGQVVFINSSAGLTAKSPDVGQYSATKHALKAIADSLREEVNPMGIRVLSVYLGRTATPMQEAIFLREGRAYQPENLLQPEDIASTVVHALTLPPTAEITDISVRPMKKSY